MGRVEQGNARPQSTGPGMQRHHKQLTNNVKPGYRVILEEVTQARKVLKLEDYHNVNPPIGYKFVPAGDPTLTTKCKEFARLDGKTVYKVIVKTTDESRTELSKQVHRVGFHFPSEIVQRAMTSLGINLDQEDDVLRKHEIWPKEEQKRKGRHPKRNKVLGGLNLHNMSQTEVDVQAKAAILDMFPAIPMDNLYQIILHAFELGTDRVGVQLNDLSLPRRVQLAVVAHIRHVYTDYDNLLHSHSWSEARARVGEKTLEILAKWRGDKDDNIEDVEDILREVLVISDDEDGPQDVESNNTSTLQTRSHVDQTSRLPAAISSTYHRSLLAERGRSDRAGARKQIWLNARERRKEPVPLLQPHTSHVYYMPRSGREPPRGVDSDQYEKRLKGLETYSRHVVDDQQIPTPSQDRRTASYLQPDSQQVSLREHQDSRQYQVPKLTTSNQFIQPLPQRNSGITSRSGNIMNTPPRARLTSQQSKLVIPSNEDILPSIETPKTDRVPVSLFGHGAIHIDSPPLEKRPDFRFLAQESIDSSPVRRKRERSPFEYSSNNLKDLTYRPVREPQQYHAMDRERHDYDRNQNGRLLYIPLNPNKTVQSSSKEDQDYDRYSVQRPGGQIYPDLHNRFTDVRTASDQGVRYQYLPLGSVQQSRDIGGFSGFPSNNRTALIPLDDYRNTEFGEHVFVENQPSAQRMIPLDNFRSQSERRINEEADIHRRNMEAYSYNDASSRRPQHEINPPSPSYHQAGLFQHCASPRATYEHRRHD